MRDASTNSRIQFSLRSLLTTVVVVAILALTFRIAWHVAVLMTTIVIVVSATFLAHQALGKRTSATQRTATTLFAVISWLLLYAVSVGPVYLAFGRFPNERPERFLSTVYAPVLWLERETLLSEPIYEYTWAWGSYRMAP